MRGVGEGTRDWDLGAGSSMTNGTVGSLVAANGRTITITYKGGEKRVVVPDDVPIVTYEPTDRTALTPGANVTDQRHPCGGRHGDGRQCCPSARTASFRRCARLSAMVRPSGDRHAGQLDMSNRWLQTRQPAALCSEFIHRWCVSRIG